MTSPARVADLTTAELAELVREAVRVELAERSRARRVRKATRARPVVEHDPEAHRLAAAALRKATERDGHRPR